MLTRETAGGLYGIPPTPFTKDGAFDEAAFRANCQAHIAAGVDGIAITGSNGEFHTMPWEMHKQVIKAFIEECQGKIHTIVSCSGVYTEEAIDHVKFARDTGADAVMNVAPYYVPLTNTELVTFWNHVMHAVPDIGFFIYNNPGTTQMMHTPAIYAQIKAENPNFIGTKEGHGNMPTMVELLRDSEIAYLTAADLKLSVSTLQLGGRGLFSMSASVFPKYLVKFYKTCKAGKWDEAIKMQYRLEEGYQSLADLPELSSLNMMARFKAMCTAGGVLSCGKSREPILTASDEQQKVLNKFVQETCADLVNPD